MNVTVMSDASYCHTHKLAGYGYWIACERGKEGGGGVINDSVDGVNCAEMMAVCNTMWHGMKEGLIHRGDTLLVQTDSMHTINALSRQHPVRMTKQEIQVITYFDEIVTKYDLTVNFRHVKGHSDSKEKRHLANNMCDQRAKQHLRAARNKIIHAQLMKELF